MLKVRAMSSYIVTDELRVDKKYFRLRNFRSYILFFGTGFNLIFNIKVKQFMYITRTHIFRIFKENVEEEKNKKRKKNMYL